MDYEKQLLNVRVSNLETFMEEVCKKLGCLPDYNDSLPTKGNSHVIKRLDALLKVESTEKSDNTTKAEIALIKGKLDTLICGWVALNNHERFRAVQESVAQLSAIC